MEYNTVIIGSGVAGMTAAIYLAQANVSVCIIEANAPGGQITRTSNINNYPGFTNIEGTDLAIKMYNQVTDLKVPYIYSEALEIIDNETQKIIKIKDKEILCQNVIIACGRTPRKLKVQNEEKLIGKGISYCATCDGGLYKDKKVAVIGGGKAALEESLYLSKICSEVTLIHRRDSFRADSNLINDVKSKNNIKILTDRTVVEFKEKDNKLVSIIISNKNEEKEEVKVDGCFEYIGQIPNTNNFKNLDILDENGYIEVNTDYETKIKNIYAIGDCIKKDLYQIITACNDGAVVASKIAKM